MLKQEILEKLMEKGVSVLNTHKENPPGIFGFPTLEVGAFTAWQSQVLNYLNDNLSPTSQYVTSFKEHVKGAYQGSAKQGIGIIKSIIEDLHTGIFSQPEIQPYNPITPLLKIFDRFHLLARQLRNRYGDRPTLDVADEYDVQNLLHMLLVLEFEDIRVEEWTPSYAGKSSRMDFLLKDVKIVIEVKKTRLGLAAKEIGAQLIDDIARYQTHPECETLLCFVYDPEGRISNPRGIENDLSGDNGKVRVKVYIRP